MGERKGVNKYYPPDYDPKKGGLNKFQGSHALRERAKKIHLGILVIRFEMPYNIWCDGCENHIGTGVRYNAEKKKVGMYYTTPVYEFRMKCHLCDNYFEIRTDPANLDYEIVSGARRQERRWDPSENEQVAPEDKAIGRKMAADAMFRLERGADDKEKAGALDPIIRDLQDFQESRWEDDFSANQLLRQRFRATENAIKAQERLDAAHNLSVPLLPPALEDVRQAALIAVTLKKSPDAIAERKKMIDTQSVFARLKPKRLSRAAKKDIAKQSIHNIVAAGIQNFNTFKNDFDKQIFAGAVVKKSERCGFKLHSANHKGRRRGDGSCAVEGGEGKVENYGSSESMEDTGKTDECVRESSLDFSLCDGSNSSSSMTSSHSFSASPPCFDRVMLSPLPHSGAETAVASSYLNVTSVTSPFLECSSPFLESFQLSRDHTKIQPSQHQIKTRLRLPSVTLAAGEDLCFVKDESKPRNVICSTADPDTEVSAVAGEGPSCSSVSVESDTNCSGLLLRSEILVTNLGNGDSSRSLLVDYSESESD